MIRGKSTATRIALLTAAMLVFVPAPAVTAAQPIATQPNVEFLVPGTVSSGTLPLRVSWAAATANDSPIYRYRLERSLDGGPWTAVSLPSRLARSATVKLAAWQVIEFRVQAEDQAGNPSEWAHGAPVWLSTAQEDDELVELGPIWTTVGDAGSFRGRRATTSTSGASATYEFEGHEVAWISMRGPKRGMADIYVDGTLVRTVDLYKSTTAKQRVVFTARWPTAGQHTLKIVNRATSGRPTIDLDAVAVIGAPTDETMVGTGDIARCPTDAEGNFQPELSGAYKTAQVVAGVDGIVYTTGDNVYLYGTPTEFANCYDPTWGNFKDRTRPSPGNHDYGTAGAAGYYDYFGEQAGPAGRGYFRYEAGTWRVYSLNSECSPTSACGIAQLEWLTEDLAAEPHRCVLAYWHRPIFSTGSHGGSTRMSAIFKALHEHGADLVLVGHDHHYERFAKATPDGTADPVSGVRQIVIGTGGAALYAFKTTSPLTEVRENTTHGVLKVELQSGSYSWEFLRAAGGSFTDSGSTACH